MSKLAIAGIVTASVAALAGSFFAGRYTGFNKGYVAALAAAAPPKTVAANA